MRDSDTSEVRLTVACLCGTIQFSPEFGVPRWAIYTFPGYKSVTCCSSTRRAFEATLGLLSAISRYFCTLNLEKFSVMVARPSSSEFWRIRLKRLYIILVRIAVDSNFSVEGRIWENEKAPAASLTLLYSLRAETVALLHVLAWRNVILLVLTCTDVVASATKWL